MSTLSTVGIETDKFNKIITEKINNSKKIKLDLKTINFKLDIKQLSLFLEAKKSNINYNNFSILTKDIKVYVDFISLLKQDLKIKKINLALEELDLIKMRKLSAIIKPSNLKSFLNNQILKGNLISEIEIFFNKEGSLEMFADFSMTLRGVQGTWKAIDKNHVEFWYKKIKHIVFIRRRMKYIFVKNA